MRFTLYTKECCPLCDDALDIIRQVQKEFPFELDIQDIATNPKLWERYRDLIPVLTLDGEDLFYGKVSAHRLKQIIQAAQNQERGKSEPLLSSRYRSFLSRLRRTLSERRLSRDKSP